MSKPNYDLPLKELRALWAKEWDKDPKTYIGRTMMVKSLEFKRWERETGGLTPEQNERLQKLIAAYKRNPASFTDQSDYLKPGTRFVKIYKGKKHTVTVTEKGFDYEGKTWSSLSEIANTITGTRWNGWLFFGVKRAKEKTL